MMKKLFLLLVFSCFILSSKAQDCEELIKYVKSGSYGTTYKIPMSEAISRVTFYTTVINYRTHYFAVVCFKPSRYSYACKEYLYLIGSNTKINYALNYLDSAGGAFWEYIQPYHKNLKCSPD